MSNRTVHLSCRMLLIPCLDFLSLENFPSSSPLTAFNSIAPSSWKSVRGFEVEDVFGDTIAMSSSFARLGLQVECAVCLMLVFF